MKLNHSQGKRIFVISLVLAMLLFTALAVGTSVIQNLGATESRLNLTMKVQYYNATSTAWEDSIGVYSSLVDIQSDNISLEDYWNNSWWNASDLSQGYGTYRVYAALYAPNGSIVENINGSLMEASYNFTYASTAQVNITSITITPDDDEITDGFQINPLEDSNKTITLIANVTNSSAIDTCLVRIWNSSDSYASPTLPLVTGTIQQTGTQTQCNATWNKEYWRNSGDWNISVDINITDTVADQENSSYYYNVLTSHEVNDSSILISGLPGQLINSSNAYPLTIRNTGNNLINISIKGTDFVGVDNSSYSIGVGNFSYSETAAAFTNLTSAYVTVYQLSIQEIKDVYFRGYIPYGTKAQDYQANISIKSDQS